MTETETASTTETPAVNADQVIVPPKGTQSVLYAGGCGVEHDVVDGVIECTVCQAAALAHGHAVMLREAIPAEGGPVYTGVPDPAEIEALANARAEELLDQKLEELGLLDTGTKSETKSKEKK